jgi:hypothetical protein
MKNVIMGILIGFGILMVVVTGIISEMNVNYGFEGDTEGFNQSLNKMSAIENITSNITSTIRFVETDTTTSFLLAPISAYKAVRIFFDSIEVVSSVMAAVPAYFGIPPWVSTLIIFSLTLSIAILFIAALARWRV